MTAQHKKFGRLVGIVRISSLAYAGAVVRMPPPLSLPNTHVQAHAQDAQRLTQIKQDVTVFTQAAQSSHTKAARPEPTPAAAPGNSEVSRQDLAHLIRGEVRQARADAGPEAPSARIRNSPENTAAYQSAASVVTTAVAAKRWTEEDKETSRAVFGQLITRAKEKYA